MKNNDNNPDVSKPQEETVIENCTNCNHCDLAPSGNVGRCWNCEGHELEEQRIHNPDRTTCANWTVREQNWTKNGYETPVKDDKYGTMWSPQKITPDPEKINIRFRLVVRNDGVNYIEASQEVKAGKRWRHHYVEIEFSDDDLVSLHQAVELALKRRGISPSKGTNLVEVE